MSIYKYTSSRLRERLLANDGPNYLHRHPRREYIVRCILSCPAWCDRARIREMMKEAKRLTKETGIPHVLGHIYPLRHFMVCGLTVPDNLRVMTKAKNDKWGNRLHLALQMELFD